MRVASPKEEFRAAVKQAKRRITQGRIENAQWWLLEQALHFAKRLNDRPHQMGIVMHRLAETTSHTGTTDEARELFETAIQLINKQSYMSYAMLLRDYGEFERRLGNFEVAANHINKAVLLLQQDPQKTQKLEQEQLVTGGFALRLKVENEDERAEAIVELKELAILLFGIRKRQYELANLAFLIEVLPLWDPDRTKYVLRAIYLSLRLGNFARATEFTVLLGGKPLRGAYRVTVR